MILADPQPHVVSACSPTPSHVDIAMRVLRADESKLLEKPIALTITAAIALCDEAACDAGVLMVAHVM